MGLEDPFLGLGDNCVAVGESCWMWQAGLPGSFSFFLTMGGTLKSTDPTKTVLIIGWPWVGWLPVVVTRCWAGSLVCLGFRLTLRRTLLQFRLCPAGGSTDRYKMGSLQEVQGRGSLAEPGLARLAEGDDSRPRLQSVGPFKSHLFFWL